MKIASHIACVLLLCSCAIVAQSGHRDPTPQDRNAAPDRMFATGRVDPAQVRLEAAELAQLANTAQDDVARATNGLRPKDLKEKLKKIEKLSKRLRNDLLLD